MCFVNEVPHFDRRTLPPRHLSLSLSLLPRRLRSLSIKLCQGKQVGMFESEEIVKYLYRTYGPPEASAP